WRNHAARTPARWIGCQRDWARGPLARRAPVTRGQTAGSDRSRSEAGGENRAGVGDNHTPVSFAPDQGRSL
ncbi:MAG: hypothetical protein ACKOFW_10040, partial [Planctomycetaceae bacterium]